MATLQSGKCFTVPTFFGMCCRSEWQERMYIYKWHEVDQTKHEIFCVHIVCNEIQVKVNLEITTFFFYLRFPYCPNFFWFGVEQQHLTAEHEMMTEVWWTQADLTWWFGRSFRCRFQAGLQKSILQTLQLTVQTVKHTEHVNMDVSSPPQDDLQTHRKCNEGHKGSWYWISAQSKLFMKCFKLNHKPMGLFLLSDACDIQCICFSQCTTYILRCYTHL